MNLRVGARILGAAMVMVGVSLNAPVDILAAPRAAAEACPDAEVVFARGSGEPVGLGGVGQAFVEALKSQVSDRSVQAYPVDYPATHDYRNSALVGASDATAHIESTVASCPDTKLVLGGYSQGASVIEMSSDSLAPQIANHVAAVTLFGTPSSPYSGELMGNPLPALAPAYRAKSIDMCIPDDIVCDKSGTMIAHLMYVQAGMPDEAATFAASRL